jgi:hypothetical protein
MAQAVFLAAAAIAAFLVPEIHVSREGRMGGSGFAMPAFSVLLHNRPFRLLVLVAAIPRLARLVTARGAKVKLAIVGADHKLVALGDGDAVNDDAFQALLRVKAAEQVQD